MSRGEYSVENRIELTPQFRKVNSEGYGFDNENYDTYFLLNSHWQWAWDSAFFEVTPEVRAVQSEGVFVETEPRALHSRRLLRKADDGESYFDFDRLNIRYSKNVGEAYIGRRPVSMGVLRFFPVWNKLTLPLLFEPGPEWVENPDGMGASVQIGSAAARIFAVRGSEPEKRDLVLGELRYFARGYELQFLAGHWWEHSVAGAAVSADAMEATWRAEVLWISRFANEESQVQSGLGIETALSPRWTLVAEGLYQSAGLSDLGNVLKPPNRFMILSGRFYAFPYFNFQVNPFWKLHAGFMSNLDNQTSSIALSGFEYSVTDNMTLVFKIKWPFGASSGEFGPERFRDLRGRTIGLASTAYLSLQTVF